MIDGRPFDDLYGVQPDLTADWISEGMVFTTEFQHPSGGTYVGHIIARDLEHAVARADTRPYGEVVMGQVGSIVVKPDSE